MSSTVLAQITEELSTNLASDRELHLIKTAHGIIGKNLSINNLTDRNDVYYKYVHRLMNITFISLEKSSADVRLAAEAYYEHILKAYECFGFPETSLKVLALSIERMNGARQVTKVVKYLLYFLDILPKQRVPDKNGRTFHQELVRTLILRSLEINQTICHQAIEKSCDRLISSVVWNPSDLKEISERALHKLWTTKGHASRTMAALVGSIMSESIETFRSTFYAHVDKVIETFVSSQVPPVGAISLIKKCLVEYIGEINPESLKSLVEMLLLMIRDSSNEIAYDAFATLEELVRVLGHSLDGFTPGSFLKKKYGCDTPDSDENDSTDFVDPLVNADLYEQLQESKPPPKVDLVLEEFDKIAVAAKPSVETYVAAFLGKGFLLTGQGNLLQTERESKDSMKILAIRVLNVICVRVPLEKFIVRIGEKTQCLLNIIDFCTYSDDQLVQQAIKFAFVVLERGSEIRGCLDLFKKVKQFRYLLDSFTLAHMEHLKNSQLLEFLVIMAFRALRTAHFDLNLPDVISAARFVGIIREWVEANEDDGQKYYKEVEEFYDLLRRCIIDCWNTPRFQTAFPTLIGVCNAGNDKEDSYPPSLPLRATGMMKKRLAKQTKLNNLMLDIQEDWKLLLANEVPLALNVKISSTVKEMSGRPDFYHQKIPQHSRLHWNSDVLPSIFHAMIRVLSDEPTKEDIYHAFHVGMAVLNWVYRNVYIVRGAAETKEIPFLQYSRVEMDDSLGNRMEFRATLDAFYKSVQSSADEKLEQLITPTVDLICASMANNYNFKTSTDNIMEIIVYIKILFTLSPKSALKLLYFLLRSLLDTGLVTALSESDYFHYPPENGRRFSLKFDLEAALECTSDDRYFIRWGDSVDLEKVKNGSLTPAILEQLEPLITLSLKMFRFRGLREKEQVLNVMICLMNHKLKLSDADPTDCLMKFAMASLAKPEECAHPELFDTLIHFLATASRFQNVESGQTPIVAAILLMKSAEKVPTQNLPYVMRAVSFALMNGRFDRTEIGPLLGTIHSTWMLCMKHAPTETLYTLSLLLEKNENSYKNQDLLWLVFLNWLIEPNHNADQVPLSAMTLPLSLIIKYLISEEVQVFNLIENWVRKKSIDNIHGKCALIAALYCGTDCTGNEDDWRRYLNFVMNDGSHTKAASFLLDTASDSLLPSDDDDDFDSELISKKFNVFEELMDKHFCGSYQDLCRVMICKGEVNVLDFVDLIEREQPNDDTMMRLLVAEFRRLEEDLDHRLDIIYRFQDLTDSLIERFETNVFLKFLANCSNVTLNLSALNITQVQYILEQVTSECLESGYVLRGVRVLLGHPRMLQLISEDELGTAKLYVKLAEKLTGIKVTDALIASYNRFRVDFQVKGDMDARKVTEIKNFTLSVFALCQEANLKFHKKFTKTQAACFRHPALNCIFHIPLVAIKCFGWIPVVEIVRRPTIACLPPTGHVCDVIVLEDMRLRLGKVGLVTNAQFEVLFTTMQAVIAHTVIGLEKLDHDAKEVTERNSRSSKALQLFIATILTSMKYPNGGDSSSGYVLKSPCLSEPFLQSVEFVHLCNLKSAWKCESRTAFTTPLERHDPKTWTNFDGRTAFYGICQTPLFSLWQLCGMMPIEFKQNLNHHFQRIDHSASNYFLTSATNIDTISNVKQLMNIFEYWYSQGIGELSEELLHAILHTIMHLSDFFDDPDLHRAVLRTTCIIYRHEYDKNPFLSSFVVIMFLKSISVLGADMNGSDFKLGEPESIALKIVSSGLASHVKTVRVHTLAGLLYLVQSESLESFAQTIGVMSVYIEKFMRNIQTGAASSEVDETQFVVALLIKLLELPFRTKQDKKVLLKLALKTLRVRRERFILELIAEGIEQLLCRSNEFNLVITHVLLVALESGDPTPFPTDNEYYCRLVYRILMVIAIRAKVAKDDIVMARVYRALQKLGFDYLSRGEAAQALSRTLPFFSICVNGVENTIIRYIEAFIVNGEDKNRRFVTTLINQVIDTAGTSKKWSVELKTFRDALHSKSETLDVHNRWLLNLLNHKLID